MAWRMALFCAVMIVTSVPCARAQAVPAGEARVQYVVSGTIVGLNAEGVANAEVVVTEQGESAGRRLQSDSAGRFTATGLRAATVSIRVRAFGYSPKTTTVTVRGADHRAAVVITLDPLAAELTTAEITAAGADAESKLHDYYNRKSTNAFAHFVDGSEIEKRKPSFVSEALRSIPGVQLSGNGRIGNTLRIRGCAPLVWVDGVRMPGAQLDEVAAPADVAAIEIYNSFAGIPSRYFDRTATCGTILVWLRS